MKPERFFMPISSAEIGQIARGSKINRHYHYGLPPKILFVVAWNREQTTNSPDEYESMRKAGIDIANMPLDSNDLDVLRRGDVVCALFNQRSIEVDLFKERGIRMEKVMKHE